jgi:hypothetical protein
MCTICLQFVMTNPFNGGIISSRAKLPAKIFLLGILILNGLTARRVYKSFGVKGLISSTCFEHLFTHHQEVLCMQQLVYAVPPNGEQNRCSKHLEVINHNKMKANSASCWSYYTDTLRCTVKKTLCNVFIRDVVSLCFIKQVFIYVRESQQTRQLFIQFNNYVL